MAYELPEFSEDLAHCDPCGWADADTEYVPAIAGQVSIERRVNPFGGVWPVFAFLKRTCLRCGFQWAEVPLSPQKPDQPELRDVPVPSGGWCGPSDNVYDIPPDLFGPHTSQQPCPAPAALGLKCSLPAGHRSPHQWGMSFS